MVGGTGRVAGSPRIISEDYFRGSLPDLTRHRLLPFMGFLRAARHSAADCISVVPSPPADTPRFSGFKPSPGQASFDADPFPPHSANRVTNRHPPTLARGVQVENLHALITNVIKRYNWIAYQPVEFTNCNVVGAPYATSDPVFSLA